MLALERNRDPRTRIVPSLTTVPEDPKLLTIKESIRAPPIHVPERVNPVALPNQTPSSMRRPRKASSSPREVQLVKLHLLIRTHPMLSLLPPPKAKKMKKRK